MGSEVSVNSQGITVPLSLKTYNAIHIELTAEDMCRIDGIAQNIVGNRYPEASMRGINL